jgi:hypothetical protein
MNLGNDSEEDKEVVQWACNAALPPEFKLGSTDVVCEGYRDADDEWVLKGSCGVEYRLLLTELGQERYQEKMELDSGSFWSELVGFLVVVLTVGALCGIVWLFFRAFFRGRGGHRGAEGGDRRDDDDDDDDPPPPYTPYPNTSRSGQQHQPSVDLHLARNRRRNRDGNDPGQGSSSVPLAATSSSTGFGTTRRR